MGPPAFFPVNHLIATSYPLFPNIDLRVGGTDLMQYEKDGMLVPPFVTGGYFPARCAAVCSDAYRATSAAKPAPQKWQIHPDREWSAQTGSGRLLQIGNYKYEKVTDELGWQVFRLTADRNPQNSRP